MKEETKTPDPKPFERFRRLVKKVVSIPKSEIDKRAPDVFNDYYPEERRLLVYD